MPEYTATQKDDDPTSIKRSHLESFRLLQGLWRSNKREQLHLKIFGSKPRVNNFPKPSDKKTQRVILELANNFSVINKKVFHWTTLGNFKGILSHKYFFGNAILKKHNIAFSKNSLTAKDISNGDGQIICFCPFLVDTAALIQHNTLREHLIRLTINLDHVESAGKYNQFFKLYDFESFDFAYQTKITDRFSVVFAKSAVGSQQTFTFTIKLKFDLHDEVQVGLDKNESIFYGDLFAINRFCLTRIFYIIEKITDVKLKEDLSNYLLSLDEAELKKVLVVFSQSLTIHSEYNFNGALKVTENLITEIYLAKQNLYINLIGQRTNNFMKVIRDKLKADSSQQQLVEPLITLIPIKSFSGFIDSQRIEMHIVFHGLRIQHSSRFASMKGDFSEFPNYIFCAYEYYESRSRIVKDTQLINNLISMKNSQETNNNCNECPSSETLSDCDSLPELEEPDFFSDMEREDPHFFSEMEMADSDQDDLPPLEEDRTLALLDSDKDDLPDLEDCSTNLTDEFSIPEAHSLLRP